MITLSLVTIYDVEGLESYLLRFIIKRVKEFPGIFLTRAKCIIISEVITCHVAISMNRRGKDVTRRSLVERMFEDGS